MKLRFAIAGAVFFIVALGAWGARSYGWYGDYWYTDVILHFISGVALGLLWLGIIFKNSQMPFAVLLLSSACFAVAGSVLWEFWEFAGWRIMPSQTQYYIPELADSLSDIFCGLLGGVTAVTVSRDNVS